MKLDSDPNLSVDDLPVNACLPEVIRAISGSVPVVLKAPPGAGKTTAVPPALLRAGVVGPGKVVIVQPRRLAARSAAARLATMMNCRLGDLVGYQVRFDNQTTKSTKLIAMTTGVLLRQLQTDPLLEDVSCVILDEFHERSLEVDLVLGMLHRIRTTFRPELKLVVMSATLNPEPIVQFLGEAIAVTSEGRSFPVKVRYESSVSKVPIEQKVCERLPEALRDTSGHVLVFLPGVGEIRKVRRAIENARFAHDFSLFELYGDLSPADQDSAIAVSQHRKVVLATNVAETSITIPGVTAVIDSGSARVMRFDSNVGLPKLQLEPVSQASAEQRAGRAGRTSPGICYRLWHEATHRIRRECDTPEIERGDFSSALLTLAAWGERDVYDFPWLTLPPIAAVENAKALLTRLGSLDTQGNVTAMGQRMLALPLHPRLARLMIAAAEADVVEDAALVVALLTERDPFRGQFVAPTHHAAHQCDILDRLDRIQNRDRTSEISANAHAVRQIRRAAQQIEQLVRALSVPIVPTSESKQNRIKRALLHAYPDRVARRRKSGSDRGSTDGARGVMVGGKGVRLDPRSIVRDGDLFLCIDVDSAASEATVRMASAIESDWLDSQLIRELDEPFYNPSLKAVVARRRRYYDDLLLAETPTSCQPSPSVAEILFRNAKLEHDSVFSKDESVFALIERIRFLTTHMPDLEIAPLDEQAIDEVLLAACQDCTSIAQLRAMRWLDHFRGRYEYEQFQQIEKHAPAKMTLPSGNQTPVQYRQGQPPYIEARIQELFGWRETPRIAGNRVPVQLRLLGPNHRPQQITDDLANFWRETYDHVRKELKRRYPKHYWPDDPLTATATRNCLKPKAP
jgi:ATP-dependent helicase HrpB